MDSDCRSNWCDSVDSVCIDGCSTTSDCANQSTWATSWNCQLTTVNSPNGDMVHGVCNEPGLTGWTGDYCTTDNQCRDGFCYDNECLNLCCTEQDCPYPYVCDWWTADLFDASLTTSDSGFKACYDWSGAGLTPGSGAIGDTCTIEFTPFYSSDCDSGLCTDWGSGNECFRFCCVDGDCPGGYLCDFGFSFGPTGTGLLRACIPE